jgi:hypothetical protein
MLENGQTDMGIQGSIIKLGLFKGSTCPVASLLIFTELFLQEFLSKIRQRTVAFLRIQLFE